MAKKPSFEPVSVRLDVTDVEWVRANMPAIRFAAITCSKTVDELIETARKLRSPEERTIIEILEGFERVADHLQELSVLCRSATARLVMVGEFVEETEPQSAEPC
jgi:hypothetical protein